MKMAKDAKHKTAFICHLGLLQYHRIPFGLTNAPATFQCSTSQLFSGQEWSYVFVYLDDILIASNSMGEHVEHIQRVMGRLGEAGLRLRSDKCVFATTSIQYLGHTLTPEGVKPNDTKVTAVKEFPGQEKVRQGKDFSGRAAFYLRQTPRLAGLFLAP